MEQNPELVYWILGGFGVLLFYMLTEQIKSSKQIAVLQKTVDDLSEDMRMFLRTEIDTLKQLTKRIMD